MAILTSKGALTTPAEGDFLHIVDVSDTTDNAAGSSKKITLTNLLTAAAPLADLDDALAGKITIPIHSSAWEPEDGASGPVSAVVAGTNQDYRELLFDGAATETAFFHLPMPKGADESAAVEAIVRYAPKGTSSGNVRWELSALAVGDGDTIDAAFGTADQDDSAAGATANVQQHSGTLSITPGGTWAAQDMLYLKLARLGGHANDTNTDDCALLGVDIIISTATLKDD